jgi:hypothetical protein
MYFYMELCEFFRVKGKFAEANITPFAFENLTRTRKLKTFDPPPPPPVLIEKVSIVA